MEQGQAQRAVTCVLRDLAASGFALFFHLLKGRQYIAEQLHDDRGRDVRHDSEGKNRKPGQRTTREHIEQAQYAALLTLKQLLQLVRVNARHRNVRTDTVHHQRQQQEHQPATQVAELVRLVGLCCVCCHGCFPKSQT